MHEEMRRIVDDLDGRRRAKIAEGAPEPARRRNLTSWQAPVIDYLKAQVLTAEKRYPEALAALERVTEAHLVRPGLFLQTGDLYHAAGPLERGATSLREGAGD